MLPKLKDICDSFVYIPQLQAAIGKHNVRISLAHSGLDIIGISSISVTQKRPLSWFNLFSSLDIEEITGTARNSHVFKSFSLFFQCQKSLPVGDAEVEILDSQDIWNAYQVYTSTCKSASSTLETIHNKHFKFRRHCLMPNHTERKLLDNITWISLVFFACVVVIVLSVALSV